jgi:hypothetical protein
MSIASDYTALLLAELPNPAEEPERAPDDYGRDILCLNSLKSGRFMSGPLLIAANHLHRLITPPKTLSGSEEDRDFGLGIHRWLGRLAGKNEAAELAGLVQLELLKDRPRTRTVSAQVVAFDEPDGTQRLEVSVQSTTGAGPLRYKVGIDSVSARFLEYPEAA